MITGSAFGQDRPVRDKPTDRVTDFRIPHGLRDNADIQECIALYRVASAEFKGEMQGFREALAAAGEDGKAAIREQIHALLKEHRMAQRKFRQKVRGIMRALREARVATDEG